MSERLSPPKRERHPLDDDTMFAAETARPSRVKSDASSIRPVPPGVAHPDGEAETHFLDYLRIVYKRRWTVMTAFVVAFGWMFIYTSTEIPLYTARVQLLIENDNPNVVKFDDVYETNKLTNDYYQTQYKILQSRLIARRTLEAGQLWKHPALVGRTASAAPPTYADYLRTALHSVWVFSPVAASASEPDPGRDVRSDGGGGHVPAVRHGDPRSQQPAGRRQLSIARSAIRGNRRQFTGQAVHRAEPRVPLPGHEGGDGVSQCAHRRAAPGGRTERERPSSSTASGPVRWRSKIGRTSSCNDSADLNAAVTKARTDRIEKQSMHDQIQKIQNNRAALDTFPAVLNNAFIQQLKVQLNELQRQKAQLEEKLGARHPDMTRLQSAIDSTEARFTTEVQKVVQAFRNDYLAAQANERALQASLEQQRGEAQELNRAAVQYGVLQRDAATDQTMFAGLLQRSRETGIAGELRTSNIRVVDAGGGAASAIEPGPAQQLPRRLAWRLVVCGRPGIWFSSTSTAASKNRMS